MKYTDVFIDLDDTVYDTRNNAIVSLRETFDEFHLEEHFPDPEVFNKAYWEANMDLWRLYSKNEIERQYLIIERFRRPLALAFDASEEYCLRMSDRFLELCSNKPGVIAGAFDMLDYLKECGCRLHIASNGFHEIQYKKMRVAGLTEYFDSVILSEDAGANKPSALFFDYALRTTGASREASLMIGDNYDNDVVGALDYGMDAMLFNRWDTSFVPPRPVTYLVNELKEVRNVLR